MVLFTSARKFISDANWLEKYSLFSTTTTGRPRVGAVGPEGHQELAKVLRVHQWIDSLGQTFPDGLNWETSLGVLGGSSMMPCELRTQPFNLGARCVEQKDALRRR